MRGFMGGILLLDLKNRDHGGSGCLAALSARREEGGTWGQMGRGWEMEHDCQATE